jgi:nitroimidazol reductase NimA-like FMN-containing flavoprotein (pyridoxamine 5'-phosphate oxidase superfamily)
MRAMTEGEIDELVSSAKWASIITVKPDGDPYAIEATPFRIGDKIGFMINPGGMTRKNTLTNPKVLLKYTFTDKDLRVWAGVSLWGEGDFVKDPEEIQKGWKLLGDLLGEDYSKVSQKFLDHPERSPLFVVDIRERTGRCSAKAGEEFKTQG